MTAPLVALVQIYLGEQSTWDETTVTSALLAEYGNMTPYLKQVYRDAAAAAADLEIPDWPDDLLEALGRRVAHNLAVRQLPLGVQPGVDGLGGATQIAAFDREVRRLEAPYRAVVIG